MRLALAVLMAMAIPAAACAQTPATDTLQPVTISQINNHLYRITCFGGPEYNLPLYGVTLIASVGPDGILLVDAGFASTGPQLRDLLNTLGNGELKTIINTHHHGDHTSGNQFIRDSATVIAHESVIERMSGYYYNLPGSPSPNQPNRGIKDSLRLNFNGEDIRIMHVPASHTSGDCYVHFVQSGIVAAGDLFFPDEIPYVDLTTDGSVNGYLAQVQSFIDNFSDPVTFHAAHGRPYQRSDIEKYRDMLRSTITTVREAAKTMTSDEMIAANTLAEWDSWRGQFPTTSLDAWIHTIAWTPPAAADRKTSICDPLTSVLVDADAAAAVEHYRTLKATQPDAYDFAEADLNMLGYQLIWRQRVDDAVGIFKLMVAEFPESWNAYDSYAEALMLAGDTDQSAANYKRSLELNSDNTNAIEMLKKLDQP